MGMHVLDLGNNSMTAEGAALLALVMEKHGELRDLNLYMNDIGSAGLSKVLLAVGVLLRSASVDRIRMCCCDMQRHTGGSTGIGQADDLKPFDICRSRQR